MQQNHRAWRQQVHLGKHIVALMRVDDQWLEGSPQCLGWGLREAWWLPDLCPVLWWGNFKGPQRLNFSPGWWDSMKKSELWFKKIEQNVMFPDSSIICHNGVWGSGKCSPAFHRSQLVNYIFQICFFVDLIFNEDNRIAIFLNLSWSGDNLN